MTTQHFGFQRAFFDHYYPAPAVAPIQPPADFAERAGRFVGSYNTINTYTTLVKIGGLFGLGYPVEISDSGDGTLLFSMSGSEWRFVEVEPLYFRQVGGPFAIVFREDERGRITHLFTDLMPQYAEIKLAWYETPGFNMALALGCVLIFLSMIPVAAIRAIRNRRLSGDQKPAPGGARVALWIILGICVLNLLFLVGMVWGVLWGTPNILLAPSLIIKIVLGLGVLSAVLTAGALAYMVLAWKNSYWGIAFRAYFALVTVAAVAFVWFMNYWNLLSWRYQLARVSRLAGKSSIPQPPGAAFGTQPGTVRSHRQAESGGPVAPGRTIASPRLSRSGRVDDRPENVPDGAHDAGMVSEPLGAPRRRDARQPPLWQRHHTPFGYVQRHALVARAAPDAGRAGRLRQRPPGR
jgi:hypothetical protein